MLEKIDTQLPQSNINGSENLWIVKPAGLSRGRDIKLVKKYVEILSHCIPHKAKSNMWVIQKYIEKPWLYNGKKFDFRVWVVVPSWNPFQVYVYDECYVRLSSANFCLENFSDKFAHLTNDSINKKNTN